MVNYYNARSSRFINFNSSGQLWNRVPDESYQPRTTEPPTPPPFSLDGLWREISLQFAFDQEILPTYFAFKEIKTSENKEIQLLSANYDIFVSNNSGDTWITTGYYGYGTEDVNRFLISSSGETIILHQRAWGNPSLWTYSNDSGQTWNQSEFLNFSENANTYYFGIEYSSINYSGNTIYSIITSISYDDGLGNTFPTFAGNRVAKTENYGNTWVVLTAFNATVPTDKIVCSSDGNYIYSLSFDVPESLIISRDGGVTSSLESLGTNAIQITDVECSYDGSIVVCTLVNIDAIQLNPELNNKLIYISRDYGVTWELTGVDNTQNIIYDASNLYTYAYQNVSMSKDGTRIVVLAKKQVINEPYVFFLSLDTGVTWQEYSAKDIIPNISNEEYVNFHRVYITPDGNELIALLKGKFNYINPYIFSLSDKTWYFADYYVE